MANKKALREALVELMQFTCNSCQERLCESDCEEEDGQGVSVPCSAILKARAALAEPPRQCDVGTAEEQEDRFDRFCKRQMCKTGYVSCPDCSIYRKDMHYCKLRWAQMPYESEGTDGSK